MWTKHSHHAARGHLAPGVPRAWLGQCEHHRQVLLHESLWVTRGRLLQNHSPSCCLQRCFDLFCFLLGHVSLDLLRKGLHQLLCLWEA